MNGDALDYWSIDKELTKIMEYQWNYRGGSQYYDFYEEQINEMANIAGDMYNELMEAIRQLDRNLPWKDVDFYVDDEYRKSGVAWFNTALALIDDIDMVMLLANEGVWSDEIKEKEKRLKVIDKLTKLQIKILLGITFNYLHRFLKLKSAFDTIVAVINELDYHQSILQGKGIDIIFHDAAYL
ncbi:MAG: hypothetical protein HPY74_06100 [Firmicutes bacterium]|nr:hypothetical protein [Bacillota bacterium]